MNDHSSASTALTFGPPHMTVEYRVHERAAVLSLANPPVNSLGRNTRLALLEAIDRANSDAAVAAVVIIGLGRGFSAGADIREFEFAEAVGTPTIWEVLEAIEASPKPVVAALHAFALGGALELALAAHYRVTLPDTKVGLPEVKLGLLPGAGGTQRLPRAVGLEEAISMIVTGRTVTAEELASTRLFDQIMTGDILKGALTFANEITGRDGPHQRVRDWQIRHSDAAGYLDAARALVVSASSPVPAPLRCLDAIEAAINKPFEEGIRLERAFFLELLGSPTSKDLRHAFLAERAAAQESGVERRGQGGGGVSPVSEPRPRSTF